MPARDALVPTLPGRPVVVDQPFGWTTFVAIHDHWFLRTRSAWRRLLKLHPVESRAYFATLSGYQRFRATAAAWYQAHGLSRPAETRVMRRVNLSKPRHQTVRCSVTARSSWKHRQACAPCRDQWVREAHRRTI